jgi:hypothetical protein
MKVIDKRGFLVREPGRETQKHRLRLRIDKDNWNETIQTYRISGAVLAGE